MGKIIIEKDFDNKFCNHCNLSRYIYKAEVKKEVLCCPAYNNVILNIIYINDDPTGAYVKFKRCQACLDAEIKNIKVRKVKAFIPEQKYIIIEDYKDVIVGNIKNGSELIYTGYNLGFAKFRLENNKSIGIPEKEAFKIVMKKIESVEVKDTEELDPTLGCV
jgi:hypothetical protein